MIDWKYFRFFTVLELGGAINFSFPTCLKSLTISKSLINT